MTLLELASEDAVQTFVRTHPHAVVTFSAHWCGPCKASKPALEQLALKYSTTSNVKFGICYEDALGTAIHRYNIRAFPTYVLFGQSTEVQRVEGANLAAIEDMMQGIPPSLTGGETLGGTTGVAVSPEAARAARLAKLGATAATSTTVEPPTAMEINETEPPPADVSMEIDAADVSCKPVEEAEDPTARLDPEWVTTLTEGMGFSLLRAQKGLLYGTGGTVEGAVEWLNEHQDDVDIDEPNIALVQATSYKCNECGKILSNMANLELHANQTGHSDFEESLQRIVPLTEEQKVAKIAEIKQLLKLKRAEREEAEKVDDVAREIQRRFMGKEMAKTKEQLDADQRKREAYLRKKEKADFAKERQRLREELARDKAERASGKGKLSSRLGVDGYKPDGIQYDVPGDGTTTEPTTESSVVVQPKAKTADLAKIDEYLAKISSYRAGGDGGKCLKVLKLYVGNVVDNPGETKYQSINMDNNAYKTKVKPFFGAKNLLLAVGFAPAETGDTLVLNPDADVKVLGDVKAKLEAALIAYG